jgi:hypothetical protein
MSEYQVPPLENGGGRRIEKPRNLGPRNIQAREVASKVEK